MARRVLIVADKIREADDTCSLRFELPPGFAEEFRYVPGQFVHVRGLVGGAPVERSYSLSSAPDVDRHFQLTVKRIAGGALSPLLVERIQVGDSLEVSEPQGRFFDENAGGPRHYLLFGAGSGVTPLFSILKWLVAQGRGDQVTLVYASRRESAIIFRSELDALAERHRDQLRVIHVLTRPSEAWSGERGRLDAARIKALLAAHAPAGALPEIAYLCGPEEFMSEAVSALKARGLADRDIRRESFDVAAAVSAAELDEATTVRILPEAEQSPAPAEICADLTVTIDGETIQIDVAEHETILAALQRHEIDAPFSCQEGTCLSCMCRVEAGAVRMRRHELIGLSPDDLGAGVALACLSKPDAQRVHVSFEDV